MGELIRRTVFGALFLVIVVGCILWRQESFDILMLIIMVGGIDEFCNVSLGEGFRFQKWMILIAGVILFTAMEAVCRNAVSTSYLALALIPVLLLPLSNIFNWRRHQMDKLGFLYSALVYIALPVSLSPYLVYRDGEYNGLLLLGLFIIIWASDVGAYCLGTALGQKENSKKLAPDISPKKSWWGFAGAVILGVAAGAVLYVCGIFEFSLIHSLVIGALVSISCVAGDLVESLWKRYFEVKDFGNLIPGHGGILDRFDSSLVAIPVASIYMFVFNLI